MSQDQQLDAPGAIVAAGQHHGPEQTTHREVHEREQHRAPPWGVTGSAMLLDAPAQGRCRDLWTPQDRSNAADEPLGSLTQPEPIPPGRPSVARDPSGWRDASHAPSLAPRSW